MKRLRAVVLAVFVATLLGATLVQAQTSTSCPLGTGIYLVDKGDTLWVKQGPSWEKLVIPNPWLKDRIKRHSADNVVAMIRAGKDILCLPPGIDVVTGVDEVVPDSSKNNTITIPAPTPQTLVAWLYSIPWWFWALVIIALAVLLRLPQVLEIYLRRFEESRRTRRELKQDPVTSGPAIVPGGIPETEPERLASHFQDRAATEYAQTFPGADTTRVTRISPIEEGMISGEGMIGYADYSRTRRIDPPQPGYRARFRFPDGSEQVLLSLQACMNPCLWGEGMSGFTFTPGRVVVPVPAPTPTPAPVPEPTKTTPEPVPESDKVAEHNPPAVEPVSPPLVEQPSGVVKLEVRASSGDKPAMVRLEGIDETADNTCELRPGVVTIRFTPRKVATVPALGGTE